MNRKERTAMIVKRLEGLAELKARWDLLDSGEMDAVIDFLDLDDYDESEVNRELDELENEAAADFLALVADLGDFNFEEIKKVPHPQAAEIVEWVSEFLPGKND